MTSVARLKSNQKWRKANPEKTKEYTARYNAKNPGYLAAKRWAKAHPRERKQVALKSRLKKMYGLTLGAYHEMLIQSSGRCELCNTQFTERHNEPAIDHDHETGRVRGLLCTVCNLSISQLDRFGKSWVEKAVAYATGP